DGAEGGGTLRFGGNRTAQPALFGRNSLSCQLVRASLGSAALNAPVAQLDRAPDYESGGRGFESCPVRLPQKSPLFCLGLWEKFPTRGSGRGQANSRSPAGLELRLLACTDTGGLGHSPPSLQTNRKAVRPLFCGLRL